MALTVVQTEMLVLPQVVSAVFTTFASGVNTFPANVNSIPTNTAGDQFMTCTITPHSATSRLIIDIQLQVSPSTSAFQGFGLFQDSTVNALAAWQLSGATADAFPLRMRHIMTSGTTSATTFKVRAGVNTGGSGVLSFDGLGGVQIFGGVCQSSIIIREIP